jgi:hypothetical protein
MHSKWQVWNFIKSNPKIINDFGVYYFELFDPLIAMLFKRRIAKYIIDIEFKTLAAEQITPNWIEANWQTMDLFGSCDSYFIQSVEQMNSKSIEQLIDQALMSDNRFLVFFSYSSKYAKEFKKIATHHHVIESAKFWEENKLLDFMLDEMEIGLSYEAKNWLLEIIEHDVISFWNALNILALNFPDVHEFNLNHLKQVLSQSRFSRFDVANLFSKKQLRLFFEQTLPFCNQFEMLIGFFSFMQTHVLKIMDSSFTENKFKLTKYDKEVVAANKIWESSELELYLELFSDLERLAKTKSVLLSSKLKQSYLSCF